MSTLWGNSAELFLGLFLASILTVILLHWLAWRTGPRDIIAGTKLTVDEFGMLFSGPHGALRAAVAEVIATEQITPARVVTNPQPKTVLQAAVIEWLRTHRGGSMMRSRQIRVAVRTLQDSMATRGLWFSRSAMRVMTTCRVIARLLPVVGVAAVVMIVATTADAGFPHIVLVGSLTVISFITALSLNRGTGPQLPHVSRLIRTGHPAWRPDVIGSQRAQAAGARTFASRDFNANLAFEVFLNPFDERAARRERFARSARFGVSGAGVATFMGGGSSVNCGSGASFGGGSSSCGSGSSSCGTSGCGSGGGGGGGGCGGGGCGG